MGAENGRGAGNEGEAESPRWSLYETESPRDFRRRARDARPEKKPTASRLERRQCHHRRPERE